MKKIMALCMIFLVLAGCGNKPTEQPNTEATQDTKIVYSNLTDEASQKEVTDSLENHGVTKEQTATLIAWVNDFNSRVTSFKLPEGFQPMEEKGVDYSGLVVQYKETEEGIVAEANCRLTSYLLMKNMITTNGTQLNDDTFLIFDVEAIDMYEQFRLSEEERSNFITFFNWVPVQGTTTVEEHIHKIQEAWKDREITIKGDKISLINVYLHSPMEEIRFVGHTGVLAETEKGLLFIEKYGPQYPFQATKFENREQLKKYLLPRPDLYGDGIELEPIIMENAQVI